MPIRLALQPITHGEEGVPTPSPVPCDDDPNGDARQSIGHSILVGNRSCLSGWGLGVDRGWCGYPGDQFVSLLQCAHDGELANVG